MNERSPILILYKVKQNSMSKQQYLKALNSEIKKLNGVIDSKIVHDYSYKSESKRHKKLLKQLRREEINTPISKVMRMLSLT